MKVKPLLLVPLLLTGLCAWSETWRAPVRADDVKVDANKIVRLKADMTSDADIVIWTIVPEEVVDAEELPGGRLYFTAPPGVYRVKCTVVPVKEGKIAGGQKTTRYVVTIGTPGPLPPPPGPGPGPGPTPPTPAPINAPGLHVLIVYESADLAKYPAEQQNTIYSAEFRGYLNQTCPPGPDGKTREWRMWDKDTDVAGESELWKNALKRAKESKDFKTPWIIVSNPDKGGGYEGPLPATKAEVMNLVKKYGG